jgi:hypothetical protein
VKSRATPNFWRCYQKLPKKTQRLADKSFELFKADPSHPSLHFKKVGKLRSVRVSINCRALAVERKKSLLWFWIGNHDDYEKLIASED